MSLFDRRELAQYIRSVTISDTCSDDQETANRVTCLKRFSTYGATAKDLLAKALSSSDSRSFAFSMSCDIFRHSPNTVNGALAMILIMAVNIKDIHITVANESHMDLVRSALRLSWNDLDTTRPSRPFQNLTGLSIERKNENLRMMGAIRIPMRPTVRMLRLVGCEIGSSPLSFQLSPALCALELVEAYVMPNTLIDALRSGPLENLRRLSMNEVEDHNRRGFRPQWSEWSVHAHEPNGRTAPCRLVQALADHAPNLEGFEFYHDVAQHDRRWPASFDSFRKLSKLHTLRIDVDRLVFADGRYRSQIIDPHDLLPDSLRHLHVTRIPCTRVNEYYKQLSAPTQVASAMDLILEAARSLPLNALYLEVGAVHEIDTEGVQLNSLLTDATISILQELVNGNGNTSNDIRVYTESSGGPQAQPSLLLSRDYRGPNDLWCE